jgi:8-amino-7-oxononanoate synthase
VLASLREELADELAALEVRGRLRACPPLDGWNRVAPTLAGHPLISFSSNDYLGLASHPALGAAAATATSRSGFGASASRLVSGDLPQHRDLESVLASFLETSAALLFPTGYQANLGVVTALASRGDIIFSDAHNHASLIDACRLSRAEVIVYPHGDAAFLASTLGTAGRQHRRRVLLTESLFSMGGDVAPLADIATLADRHQAVLVVDEAHALGTMGPSGAGLCRAAGIAPDAVVGTLGKAFGAFGGFVAGSSELRQLLVNRARTFIFTTAPPPAIAAAAAAGVALARGPEGETRRQALFQRVGDFRSALPGAALGAPAPLQPTPIVPVVLGHDARAVAVSRALRAQGFFVPAIRPPTVPEGTARLRITLSAEHRPEDVAALTTALRPLLGC